MSVATLSRHPLLPIASKVHYQCRRGLATGLIYIDNKPAHTTRKTLIEAAQKHSLVYDVWISAPILRKNIVAHRAAIRITTDAVPETLEAISLLPDPTKEELDAIKTIALATVATLKADGVNALPILKDPGFFQTAARRALGYGPSTRLFDKRTTSKPRYTRGMLDGYRAGFLKARQKRDANSIVEQSKKSENALEFLAGYFEHKFNNKL
ncbi:hypothetical protein GGI19_002068 [Coemansia pectinata]|uniref:Uncharacterized protein n=1 Tax=Coemansia pectinata TaxID=1052879 RepID=A0A9W8GWI9_9FUNG|nr:hypothetical protein GGI19_002068 [Coemansia pectinata]